MRPQIRERIERMLHAERELGATALARAHLAAIDRALALLATDPETLERCERCRRLVELERLVRVPWSRRCATCAGANGLGGAG